MVARLLSEHTLREVTMNKLLFIIPVAALSLAGCQTANQNAAAGAVAGGVIGAAVSNKDDRLAGAALGAAAGVAASTLIGTAPGNNNCYYRNSRGERFIAAC
jgi:outer membrane lipoprotein SlyB